MIFFPIIRLWIILTYNPKFFSNFIQMEYFQIGGNSVSNRVFCRRDLNESTRGMRGQKYTHTYKERERDFSIAKVVKQKSSLI